MRKLLIGSLAASLAAILLNVTAPGRAFAQNVACYLDQGGAAFHLGSGCTQTVESGGQFTVASGGGFTASAGSTSGIKPTLYVGGTGAAGGAGVSAMLVKQVTAIADNTATTIFTVSVPNANHQAVIPVTVLASLGAGGAVGAGECSATLYGQIVVTRTAGLATVATATTASNTGSACVAGATTETLAYSVTSMTGANSATQTFNIQITIAKGGGSSANHYATVDLDLINSNASGITVS